MTGEGLTEESGVADSCPRGFQERGVEFRDLELMLVSEGRDEGRGFGLELDKEREASRRAEISESPRILVS